MFDICYKNHGRNFSIMFNVCKLDLKVTYVLCYTNSMKIKNYTVILKKEPEGGYTAIVPSLPGCVTYSESIEQAQEMAKDAIGCYVASMVKHGEKVVEEKNVFLTSVSVQSSGIQFAHA